MKVVFENDGEIDILAMKTFGISAKDCVNPIGYFGTGMKYAAAILMREKCSLLVSSGTQVFTFGTKHHETRGRSFGIVTMNDQDLAFTTHLGANWEIWQAFRELYCNCLDENGKVYEVEDDFVIPAIEGKTFIVIGGDAFYQQFLKKGEIVLDLPSNIKTTSLGVDIYDVPSQYVYYRGIRVDMLVFQSLFTYNIKDDITLTEDRTVRYEWQTADKIMLAIGKLTNQSMLKRIFTAPRNTYEKEVLAYSTLGTDEENTTKEFMEEACKEWAANNDSLTGSLIAFLLRRKEKATIKNYAPCSINKVQDKQLKRAIEFAREIFSDIEMYPITIVETLGQSTHAVADPDLQRIIVSKKCFDLGTKYLCSTIIEEFVHLNKGHKDCTREMQTYLFDMICTMIEHHIVREPI